MKTHEVKTLPKFFRAQWTGMKTFEVRNNDRDYQVGDMFVSREWSVVTGYSGREIRYRIDYVLSDPNFGLQPGFVALGLGTGDEPEPKTEGKVEPVKWSYPSTGANGAPIDSLSITVDAARPIPDLHLRFHADRSSWIIGGLFKTGDGELRFMELASIHEGELDEDRLLEVQP